MWECANCGEAVEVDFDVCWNCQTEKGSLSSEGIWQQKSDEELITASEHLSEYTKGAEEIIRAELQRRRMPEPEPTVRTVDENTGSGNPVVQTKYPALRVISVIFKVLAVLAAIAGLIGALVGLVQMSENAYGAGATGGVIVLVSLLYGGLGCLYSLAISEGIRVFIDMEANTRLTNKLLRKLLDR